MIHGETAPIGLTLYSGAMLRVGFGRAPAVVTAAPAIAAWLRATSSVG